MSAKKMGLGRNIKELNKKVEALSGEKEAQINEIKKLKMDVAVLTNANNEYEKKYVNTNLECSFCYTTLQKNFVYCPKCGKKIERKIQVEIENKSHNMFEIENDKCDIYAVMYEAENNSVMLNGDDVFTSDKLVSLARIKPEDVVESDQWTDFEIPFEPVKGRVIDDTKLKNGKYKLGIVLSSSVDGAYFKGAVGSTLYVDEVELICED